MPAQGVSGPHHRLFGVEATAVAVAAADHRVTVAVRACLEQWDECRIARAHEPVCQLRPDTAGGPALAACRRRRLVLLSGLSVRAASRVGGKRPVSRLLSTSRTERDLKVTGPASRTRVSKAGRRHRLTFRS